MEFIGKLESPFEIKDTIVSVNADDIFSAVVKVVHTFNFINLQLYNVVISTPEEKVQIKEGPKQGCYLTYECFSVSYRFYWANDKTFETAFAQLRNKFLTN
jgi:hypothetical protein